MNPFKHSFILGNVPTITMGTGFTILLSTVYFTHLLGLLNFLSNGTSSSTIYVLHRKWHNSSVWGRLQKSLFCFQGKKCEDYRCDTIINHVKY